MTGTPSPTDTQRASSKEFLARQWWEGLQRQKPDGQDNREANPGALARLRRCATPLEALAEPVTLQLCRRLGCRGSAHPLVTSIALLAIVLAHVREDTGQAGKRATLAGMLGAVPEGREMPVLNPLRLKRLMAARDDTELLRGFREAVTLLGRNVPVQDLSRTLLGWLDPQSCDRTRTRFLFAYYGASEAAPPDDGDATDAA